MRRIYESPALGRDDDDPFAPGTEDAEPRAMRSVNGGTLSRLLLPARLGDRALSVAVSTPQAEYPERGSIPFTVTMKNALPVPISVRTESPVLWTWTVDGAREASRVPVRDPPDEAGVFEFDRGERKQFRRRWDQLFRVSDSEWERADPGTYTIAAEINVGDPETRGLSGTTTVQIVPG